MTETVYKTKDTCPTTGKWLIVETGEICEVIKGDEFPPYHKQGDTHESGIGLHTDEPSRAHYKLVKEES